MEPLTHPITSSSSGWASLSRDGARARRPEEIARALSDAGVEASLAAAVGEGLADVWEAIGHAFPDNIFGDLDLLAFSVAREAAKAPDPEAHARRALSLVASLMHLFGRETPIRFRYVHDFVYGYDWARWVKKAPEARADVGPFDLAFLERMERRGHELLALIEAGDEKYPVLRDDRPRNPFRFSREPADERRLFSDLAARGLLPVESWRLDAEPEWSRDFGALREERAQALGLV